MLRHFLISLIAVATLLPVCSAQTTGLSKPSTIVASSLDKEVRDFLDRELLAHLDEIKTYDPPPAKVFNLQTTGEYTWGNFMYALGTYAGLAGKQSVGRHDLAREVGEIGLLEYRLKGTRFSQLYGVMALQFFGRDLKSNPVWQSLSEQDREHWRQFLDVSAFYDPKTILRAMVKPCVRFGGAGPSLAASRVNLRIRVSLPKSPGDWVVRL